MERPREWVLVMETEGVVGSKEESMVVVVRLWVCVAKVMEGWNSLASGLKENCRGEDVGERCLGKGDGGGARVDERDIVVDAGRGVVGFSLSPPLNPKCILFALLPPPFLSTPGGKYEIRPLNFSTSALALTRPQRPSISAYCSRHARYNHSFPMSNNGALKLASSSN